LITIVLTISFTIKQRLFARKECAGLPKPGEVGEIPTLYRLKSLSLDYKAKLKSPCFFLQVTLFLQIIFALCQIMVKLIVINEKIHKNKRKRFYSSNKEGLIC
jgi:hypothetical protein